MGSFFAPTLASFFVASLFTNKKNSSNTKKNETHKNTFLIKHSLYIVVFVVVVRALLGSQRDNARRDM